MKPKTIEEIYAGKIKVTSHGEADDILFVGDENDPFAKVFQDDLERYGNSVTLNYYITDTEQSEAELDEKLIRRMSGDAEADYGDAYSEYTGYLWTDEELKVGGHDLLEELRSNKGKYLFMKVKFGGKNEQA